MQHVTVSLPEPNTFIGNGGTAFPTAASFDVIASGAAESDIKGYTVDGSNNVSFYIGINYSIFSNLTNAVTYFIDLDGKVTSTASFSLLTNNGLKYLYLKNLTSVPGGSSASIANITALLHINLESIIDIGRRWLLQSSTNLKKIDFRGATNMSSNSLQLLNNLSSLERAYVGNLATVADYWNAEAKARPNSFQFRPPFELVKTGCKIYVHSSQGTMNRNAYGNIYSLNYQVGDEITMNGLIYKAVGIAPAANGEFDIVTGSPNPNVLASRLVAAQTSDPRIGTLGTITSYIRSIGVVVFTSNILGVAGNAITLSFNPIGGGAATVTAFKGGNDIAPWITYARDIRSATIIECTAPITVNPPTGLSYSSLTSNSCVLDFTLPTANANGNDGYEVWVEDATLYRKLFEYAEVTASGQVLNLAEVVTDLGTISGVKIKIRTIDGQFNFSDFSNEITLP